MGECATTSSKTLLFQNDQRGFEGDRSAIRLSFPSLGVECRDRSEGLNKRRSLLNRQEHWFFKCRSSLELKWLFKLANVAVLAKWRLATYLDVVQASCNGQDIGSSAGFSLL